MDVDDFRSAFRADVTSWAESGDTLSHYAFIDVASHYLEEFGEFSDVVRCYYRKRIGNTNALIDGYSFDDVDGSVRFLVCAPKGNGPETLSSTEAATQLRRLRWFIEKAIDGKIDDYVDETSEVLELANRLRERFKTISRFRTYLVTDQSLGSAAHNWSEEVIHGIPVEAHVWDINRLFLAHLSATGRDELVVKFAEGDDRGIPCLRASTNSSEYAGYLCVVSGKLLADIYDKYGSLLLEGNVRAFLSARGKVNRGIRTTIEHEAAMFFAYNNGIAATARSVEVERDGDALRLTSATDFQIVNGGQTTASLSHARRVDKRDLASVFVPMKLSVVLPERSVELIPQISRFANSQNKVNEADFFANHEFHREMERISRRLLAPAKQGSQHDTYWFYERARGQYLNEMSAMTAAEQKRFLLLHPRNQVITKTDLAKYENSFAQLPHLVSTGAQSNFARFAISIVEKWKASKDSFNELYFKGVVAKAIIFKATEKLVESQKWYGGYRANVVTYSLAKLAQLVDGISGRALDLETIWKRQGIDGALEAQLVTIADAVQISITHPPQTHSNVTQWCKREECWANIQKLPVELSPSFVQSLAELKAVKHAQKEAAEVQQLDSEIANQVAIVERGVSYWKAVLQFGKERGLLSPEDERATRVATAYSTTAFPTPRQAARLLLLEKRLEEEGFRYGGTPGT